MNEALENINKIISAIDEIVTEYGDTPTADSQFEKECSNYPDKPRINEPFTFGRLNLRAAREQLSTLPYLSQNNIFASSVVARAVLEASSLAVWFLSPGIDETERVKRGLIQLCDGKNQIRKFFRDEKQTADVARIDDFFATRLPVILANLGIEFRNANGDIVEPQIKKPSIIDLIDANFGAESRSSYRILSGFAHGQANVLITFGYDIGNPASKSGLNEVEFKPSPSITIFALKTAVESFMKATEAYFQISNWDFAKVKPTFDDFFTSLYKSYENNRD